ncbi:MAG: hypothetical protein IT379_14825 [Deltaproteobacteria bacterium]|nr:hypothetical protein [Deltaproteobacteria bacterium]
MAKASSLLLAGFLLAACNCADPVVRASPGGDAGPDAPSVMDATHDEHDAATADMPEPRERDAYLPRDPPPDPAPHACAGGTSMRRLHESVSRSMGRSAIGTARWGDGLALTWQELPPGGAWRTYAGWLADPVAGALDVGSVLLGGAQAFVTTSDGRLRAVSPTAYADVSDGRLGPIVELPPRPTGFDRAFPFMVPPCRGAEAVAMLLERDDADDMLSVLAWIDGEPRWYEPANVPGAEVLFCAAVGDSVFVGRRAEAAGGLVFAQWTSDGTLLRSDGRIDTGGGTYVEADVVLDVEGRATVVTAAWSDLDDPRFAAHSLDADGPRFLAETTVETFGPPYHMLGAGTLRDKVVIAYYARYLTSIDFDPATGAFGAPALVADHPCFGYTNTVTLPSGVYAALECYFEEVWLLRMCGDTP